MPGHGWELVEGWNLCVEWSLVEVVKHLHLYVTQKEAKPHTQAMIQDTVLGGSWGQDIFTQHFDSGVHFPALKIFGGLYLSQKNLSKGNKALSSRVNTSEFVLEKCELVSSRAFFFSGRDNNDND